MAVFIAVVFDCLISALTGAITATLHLTLTKVLAINASDFLLSKCLTQDNR